MKLLKAVTSGVVLLLMVTAWADIPKLINFQGILKDTGGSPFANDTVAVVFTIYDDPSAGNVKWTETDTVITNGDGLFSILLGAVTPIADTAFTGASRWLGMKVESDAEMTPRQQLVSMPYSYEFDDSTLEIHGDATIDTNTFKVYAGLNQVSLGSDTAGSVNYPLLYLNKDETTSAFRVTLDLRSQNAGSGAIIGVNSLVGQNTAPGTGLRAGVVGLAEGTSSICYGLLGTAQGAGTNYAVYGGTVPGSNDYAGYFVGNRVHVGTAGSEDLVDGDGDLYVKDELEVDGAVEIAGNAKVMDTLFASNVSSLSPLKLQTNGTTRMHIDDVTGNVGVGTTSPNAGLHVRGGSPPRGIIVENDSGSNSDDLRIKRPGAESPGNPRFSISERSSNTDLWLYGYDGTTFKNFVGFHFPTNTITFPADGSNLYIDNANSRVGIGTASPTAPLTIQPVTGTEVQFAPSGNNVDVFAASEFRIGTSNSSPLSLITNNLFRLTVSVSGNIGVGTTNPQSALQVSGYMQMDLTTGAPPAVDCDAASEYGRMKFDAATNTLYICGSSGWATK